MATKQVVRGIKSASHLVQQLVEQAKIGKAAILEVFESAVDEAMNKVRNTIEVRARTIRL